jgi:serine/threonine-protein kinase ATR
MANNQRAGTNGQRTNGVHHGESDAPPSTMAAQLISNMSNGNKPSRSSEGDDLKRLMAEISQIESQGTETGNRDVQLQNSHKLIYVLTRAVFDRLTQNDPFMDVTKMVSHASDALDVFVNFIRETPDVLLYSPPEEEQLQGRGQEQLWLWIFPRLLPFLGSPRMVELTEKLRALILLSFEVVAISPKLWPLSSSIFEYLKDCVSCM